MDEFKNHKMQLLENQNHNKMKTRILSIAALLAFTIGLSKPAHADDAVVTNLTDVTGVNKIEVHGNVELFISDGAAENVKVYNQYYGESALVQNHNGVLRIASYKTEKLVVWVTLADLRSVTAYDDADVRTFGNFSKIEFNVELHNRATASLNIDAFSANVKLTDHAKANLTGSVNEYSLTRNGDASVNSNNFKAVHFTENKNIIPVSKNEDEMVGL
jgi:hypothetical protein